MSSGYDPIRTPDKENFQRKFFRLVNASRFIKRQALQWDLWGTTLKIKRKRQRKSRGWGTWWWIGIALLVGIGLFWLRFYLATTVEGSNTNACIACMNSLEISFEIARLSFARWSCRPRFIHDSENGFIDWDCAL